MLSEMQIISRLWSVIFDLLLYAKGKPAKSIETIERDIDVLEYRCRPYAQEGGLT